MPRAPSRTELQRICGAWPGVSSDVKWGADLVYSVAGKMFVVMCLEGGRRGHIGFKVPDEQFLAVTELPGIIPSPYAARFKWVSLTEPQRYGRDWLAARLRESYELVAARLPRKTRAALGLV